MGGAHGHGGKPDKITDGVHPDGSRKTRPMSGHVQAGHTPFLHGHGPDGIDEVCRFYGVKDIDLLTTRRGRRNAARNAAIYLTRKLRMDTYQKIGDQYGIENDRTVRSVFVRMKKTLAEDKKTARKMEKLIGRITS